MRSLQGVDVRIVMGFEHRAWFWMIAAWFLIVGYRLLDLPVYSYKPHR